MFDIAVILAQLALIIVVARVAGALVAKVGIPPVVGEIFAGVALGPSLIGPTASQHLFPADTVPFLSLLSNVGLVLFMFVVGLELDVALIRGRERVAASVSVLSILLPFSLGVGLANFLDDLRPDGVDFLPFALFMGASMSITAFPVLARILTDRRMHRTETGGISLACAATDDVLAWTILAVVVAIAGGDTQSDHGWLVYLAIPFALLAIFVVRPALTVLTRMYAKAGELTPTILSIVLVGLLLSSAATEYLHIHYIFGAFLFGAIIPHEQAAALRHEILVRLEQISVLLLLPVFFLISGLKVDLRGLDAHNLVQLVAILMVAIVGKYVGAYVGARWAGVPHWQSNALGILMNTRGLTELVILNVGLSLGLLSVDLFTMMVVMALVTTVMTGPLLARAYPQRRVARDIAEAERAALGEDMVDRVLVVSGPTGDDRAAVDCAVAMLAGARPAEIVVADLQPQGRLLEVGSGLSGELADMAAAMEQQEGLVRRGRELGIPVRVIAHPSADVQQDLVELVAAIAPQGLVLWADDPTRTAVLAAAECPVAVVPVGAAPHEGAVPVVVRFDSGADSEAAVVLGARIAARTGAALVLAGDSRRVAGIRSSLERRGVRLLDSADEALALVVAPFGTDGVLTARAEADAAPVDFDVIELGTHAESAQA
ncbi:cation:proton antiporter [Nocardioides panacisoli]|uniref:Cation/H+ exchanger transmembrane domain-containing protein n=1 Tax=Nocardioides panacisoli TaxID=627624 RepID=A0ABP7J6T8_9ACTN